MTNKIDFQYLIGVLLIFFLGSCGKRTSDSHPLVLKTDLKDSLERHDSLDKGKSDKSSDKPVMINDWQEMNLNGRVKSLIEIQYRIVKKSGQSQKTYKGKQTLEFNENGRLSQKIDFDDDPRISQVYDRKLYLYNREERLVEIRGYGADSTLRMNCLFKHDNNGNVIEEDISGPDKRLDARYTFLYDKNGKKIEMNRFNMKTGGNHDLKERYAYDLRGNITKKNTEHASGNFGSRYKYTYDAMDRIVEKNGFDFYSDGQNYEYQINYKYDSQGNLIAETEKNKEIKGVTKTIISLDDQNNWIERTTTDTDKTVFVTERKIEYFD